VPIVVKELAEYAEPDKDDLLREVLLPEPK
jgi:hypothetical protein